MKRGSTPPRARRFDETDFLVVDVETTGLSAESGERVCELGAVKLRGSAVVESYNTFTDPRRPISAGAYAVNRISPAMLAGAPLFAEIAPRLLTMMADAVIVAYNAPFDISFLNSEFRMAGFRPLDAMVVDALVMARQILPGLQGYPQEHVARMAGIAMPVKHRALEDAMVTAQLFLIFTSILKAHNIDTCADLQSRDLSQRLMTHRIRIVREALAGRQNLWIKYLSPADAEISDRMVTPRECIEGGGGSRAASTLVAYCHSTRVERDFRLDRILDARIVQSPIR